MSSDPLVYYAQPGPLTTLKDDTVNAALLAGLPTDIPGLARVAQGNLLHVFWAERYGVTLSDERKAEVQIRTAAEMLCRIHAVDPAPLTNARPVEKRLVGNCRDFTVLTVALLRHQGIPARARCGFGTYFQPGYYEDHWVAEYWNAGQNRWIMVDAQLDAFQVEQLQVDFDPLDVPSNRFITGGHAWQMITQQGADAQKFGIFDMRGTWFVVGDLLRDLAALNKIELLPWDGWGLMLTQGPEHTPEETALLDRTAALTLAGNDQFDAMRAFYDGQPQLRVPDVLPSFPGGPEAVEIDLTTEPGIVWP